MPNPIGKINLLTAVGLFSPAYIVAKNIDFDSLAKPDSDEV